MGRPAFLSHSGPDPLEQLCDELARRGLGVEDLLRLRLFAADCTDLLAMLRKLESLLPRAQWPALSAIEIAADGARAPALDAVAAPGAHQMRVAIRASDSAGAMRFGPWLFVGALSAPSPRRASLPERIELESRALFARIERLLRAGGAHLRHVVKVGGWLSFPMSDYEPLGKVRSELLERSGLLPASAAVQTGPIFDLEAEGPDGASSDAAPLLSFEAIAFVPPRLPPDPPPQGLAPTVTSPLAPYYASARRAGDYVLTCGEIPRKTGPIEHEVRDVCQQLHVHLAEHGALLRDVVQQTVFVRHSHDIPAVERELAACLHTDPIATTIVPALDMGFRQDVNVEVEMIAAIAPADRR